MRFQSYRFLMFVYVPALAIAAWEIFGGVYQPGEAPDPVSARETMKYDYEFSRLHVDLYPDRPRSEYFRGASALFIDKDPHQARRHFERGLASGIKTDEDLLYYYAYTLALLREDPATVAAAVADWRRNFPQSRRPDPAEAVRQARAVAPPGNPAAPKSTAVRPYPSN